MQEFCHRLNKKLDLNIPLLVAQCPSKADLASSFGYGNEYDIHHIDGKTYLHYIYLTKKQVAIWILI
jgi:hypothetical protein